MKIFKHTVARIRNSKGDFEGIPALMGESIYDAAVRYGYVGTEEEYLADIISNGWITGIAKVQSEVDTVETDVAKLKTDVNNLGTKVSATTYTATLASEDWTQKTNYATKTIDIAGLLTTDIIVVDIDMPPSGVTGMDTLLGYVNAWSKIVRANCEDDGKLSFLADGEAPTVNIPIKVLVVR